MSKENLFECMERGTKFVFVGPFNLMCIGCRRVRQVDELADIWSVRCACADQAPVKEASNDAATT